LYPANEIGPKSRPADEFCAVTRPVASRYAALKSSEKLDFSMVSEISTRLVKWTEERSCGIPYHVFIPLNRL